MIAYTDSFEKIAIGLSKLGIPTDRPSFCDHPNFLSIEKLDPTFLNVYASYVCGLRLDAAYLERARKEIPVITNALHKELVESGRRGACVDASGVLFRILEQEGLWSCVIKGSLTIDFPKATRIGKRYFWTIDQGNFVAAHAWIVAPPFKVIDFTVRLQNNTDTENEHLPDMLLVEEAQATEGTAEDIFAPEAIHELLRSGIRMTDFFSQCLPHLVDFMRVFPAQEFLHGQTHFKYIPTAIGAPDCELEKMVGMSGKGGKNGSALYRDVVCPALATYRQSLVG
jgi:hypothetical protein